MENRRSGRRDGHVEYVCKNSESKNGADIIGIEHMKMSTKRYLVQTSWFQCITQLACSILLIVEHRQR